MPKSRRLYPGYPRFMQRNGITTYGREGLMELGTGFYSSLNFSSGVRVIQTVKATTLS
jgi:hypothetical protein